MTSSQLDSLIDTLKDTMPPEPWTVSAPDRHDWRPIWELCRTIQEGFKSGVRYPSRAERDAAWTRFNGLRDTAHKTCTLEREALEKHSRRFHGEIMEMLSGITYSPVTDILFFFDRTTADQVKVWGRYLGKAMKALSDHKHEMTREHKKEVFEKIQEVKESHDLFWGQYKSAHESRFQDRKEQTVTRIGANLTANRERLAKAQAGFQHARERVVEIEDKIATSTSSKWEQIFRGWLDEAESKVSDIERTIAQIEEWIAVDEERLRRYGV